MFPWGTVLVNKSRCLGLIDITVSKEYQILSDRVPHIFFNQFVVFLLGYVGSKAQGPGQGSLRPGLEAILPAASLCPMHRPRQEHGL